MRYDTLREVIRQYRVRLNKKGYDAQQEKFTKADIERLVTIIEMLARDDHEDGIPMIDHASIRVIILEKGKRSWFCIPLTAKLAVMEVLRCLSVVRDEGD